MTKIINYLDLYFNLTKKNTNIKTEFIAGLTTFLAMAYILVINPLILGSTGMDQDAIFAATAISAIIGTLIMGIYANLPLALASGMGMNAMFAISVTVGGLRFEEALGAVFLSGFIFLVLSMTGVREKILRAIPQSQKSALSVGIGLFIAFIGLKNAGLIVASEGTFVTLGNLKDVKVMLALFGIITTVILYVKEIKGSIFIGIILTTILGFILGEVATPTGIVSGIPSLAPSFGKFLNPLLSASTYTWTFGITVFTFLFIDFFDTAGFLVAIAKKADLEDSSGEIQGFDKALYADSISTTVGAIFGTSNVTTFGESLAGIGAGGRTGLTSVFTALFLFLALFFRPFLSSIPAFATAPALMIVGSMMLGSAADINWDDKAIAFPAFATIIFTVLTFSVATGIAIGFIMYPITMVASKRQKEVNPILWILCIVFILYFILK